MKAMKLAALLVTLVISSACLGAAEKYVHETCCTRAKAAGKKCDHKCCVKAEAKGKQCEKCNGKKKEESK